MRYKLSFNLENGQFPIDYRKSILSFIKLSISEYSEEEYKKLYNEKDTTIKPYTFAVFFCNPKFNKEEIIIESKKFEINISIEDYNTAVILYNSFNHQRNKKFSLNKNSCILQKISLMPEKKIDSESIKIKFMSPLVVRNRNREIKKDYYYSFENEKFLDTLRMNIKEQLKISNISTDKVDSFEIKAIKPKKTVIKFYEKQIECSLGEYEISGDKELLRYLYQAGVGSKHSVGFRDVPSNIEVEVKKWKNSN